MDKLVEELRSRYRDTRLPRVDRDFLEYEEEMASEEDKERIIRLSQARGHAPIFTTNPHNSVLLFVTGLTDDFDFDKARADTRGGSPPDIDIDFGATDRHKATEWVIEKWGRENVANIVTHGSLKPKSLARRFFKVTEGDPGVMREVLGMIPQPQFGKEAKLKEVLEGNPDKGYQAHPQLKTNARYSEFYEAAEKLENLVANFGIHAAGLVISDFPISDLVPVWSKVDSELQEDGRRKKVRKWITQFDMKEVEELGLIKFDFLAIDNLSIIKECTQLIRQHQGKVIDPYTIEDGDEQAYKMMHQGLLTGVFQMETSGSAKQLIARIEPTSIEELSDINALNRPGPLQANLDEMYIENKNYGYAPTDLPPAVAEILKDTYWTLVYQEQVMQLCSQLAGFSLKEADDIRRAMGKKKHEVLDGYKPQFIEGCKNSGLSQGYAQELWETLEGFADYCLDYYTFVVTSAGPMPIGFIVENRLPVEVLSVDKNGNLSFRRVTQWHNRGIKQTYTYEFEDGTTVTCTPDHQFQIDTGEWKSIEEIFQNGLQLTEHKVNNDSKIWSRPEHPPDMRMGNGI